MVSAAEQDAASGQQSYVAPNGEQIRLRQCRGWAELDACVELQEQTWGYPDREITPRKGFLLAQELGGQVMGAFAPDGRMVGMAMAMAAFEPARLLEGRPAPPRGYLHSHMLAVSPAYQNQGLGTRLKLAQRADALARGITRMTWTFDPLAAKNAYLNLHRLGAIARRYSADFYGVSSSRLQGGLPTDRLHAEWWLDSPRVRGCVQALTGGEPDRERIAAEQIILLPREVEQWKQSVEGREQARALQDRNRALFLEAFASGRAVVDFVKDASGNGVFELASWPGASPP